MSTTADKQGRTLASGFINLTTINSEPISLAVSAIKVVEHYVGDIPAETRIILLGNCVRLVTETHEQVMKLISRA